MPLNARQELEIKLGETIFYVRPEYSALANVEMVTGQPAVSLGYKMAQSPLNIGISDMASIIWALIAEQVKDRKRDSDPQNINAVGAILFADGYQQYITPIAELFIVGMKGHKEHVREAELAAQRQAEVDAQGAAEKPTDPPEG